MLPDVSSAHWPPSSIDSRHSIQRPAAVRLSITSRHQGTETETQPSPATANTSSPITPTCTARLLIPQAATTDAFISPLYPPSSTGVSDEYLRTRPAPCLFAKAPTPLNSTIHTSPSFQIPSSAMQAFPPHSSPVNSNHPFYPRPAQSSLSAVTVGPAGSVPSHRTSLTKSAMEHATTISAGGRVTLFHPYARLHATSFEHGRAAKSPGNKRRRLWSHALEKSVFTSQEL